MVEYFEFNIQSRIRFNKPLGFKVLPVSASLVVDVTKLYVVSNDVICSGITFSGG